MSPTARVGTSGWVYPHWRGEFYPPGLPASQELRFYAQRLRAVEVNSTFYGTPSAGSVAAWRAAVPPGFVFAVKANRFVTHMKKLKDPETSLERFTAVAQAFGEALGPVLFQLPPRFKANPGRLDAFLAIAPRHWRCVLEFRDPTWMVPGVLAVLARHNAAFCIYDLAGYRSPLEVTAEFVYLRLHGPGHAYQGLYDLPTLEAWAGRINVWLERSLDVYCFFDNDQAAFAAQNALQLASLLGQG